VWENIFFGLFASQPTHPISLDLRFLSLQIEELVAKNMEQLGERKAQSDDNSQKDCEYYNQIANRGFLRTIFLSDEYGKEKRNLKEGSKKHRLYRIVWIIFACRILIRRSCGCES
jgi:hypothetical protein